MRSQALSTEDALRSIQVQARYLFSPEEFAKLTGRQGRSVSTRSALMRLSTAGRIVLALKRPTKWLIVPAEHSHYGAPPVDWWLHDCLEAVEPSYYLALLSAARHWGSAHYARQTTQVMVGTRRSPQQVGQLRVEYTFKAEVAGTPVVVVKGAVSKLRVSTREATLLDLLRHQSTVGGLEAIVRVAHDFRDKLVPTELVRALDAMGQTSVAQRLGLVFEVLGQSRMSGVVREWLKDRPLTLIPFETGALANEEERQVNRTWAVRYSLPQIEALRELV